MKNTYEASTNSAPNDTAQTQETPRYAEGFMFEGQQSPESLATIDGKADRVTYELLEDGYFRVMLDGKPAPETNEAHLHAYDYTPLQEVVAQRAAAARQHLTLVATQSSQPALIRRAS